MSLIAYTRTVKLISRDDPFYAMAIEPYDNEIIDLWALQFMFAVEKKDAKYGRLEVAQVSIQPDSEQITPIEMVDC